jgi:HD-GYP domain-containing protein (c-di-GMP phosphodiesterase class II)
MSTGPGSYHALAVGLISGLLAKRLGLEPERLYLGGLLHDIGGIGIFENIVSEPLFSEKWLEDDLEFKLHPEVSYRMVKEFLNLDITGIKEHHELFNGKGYPGGKAGEEISTGGYVIGIADKFEIISRIKGYRLSEIRKVLKEWCDTIYPAFLVDELLGLLHEDRRLLYDIQTLLALDGRLVNLESSMVFSDILIKEEALYKFFSIAIALKHPYTLEHSERVCYYSKIIGEGIELDQESMMVLETSAYLHDIGKVGIPRGLLEKPAALSSYEARLMMEHVLKTYEILNVSKSTKELAFIASSHHEALDGSGYPFGLYGEEIPLISRIISICDIYDALTSSRAYRSAYSKDEALSIMEKEFKEKIDMGLFETFRKNLKEEFRHEL